MKRTSLILSLLGLFSTNIFAAIPASPLNSEYTVVGNESVVNSGYVIGDSGILNIGSDSLGDGVMNLDYYSHLLMLSGNGSINIGTQNTSGALYFNCTNSSLKTEVYSQIIDYKGSFNIGAMGKFVVQGYVPSTYGNIIRFSNINLYGSIDTDLPAGYKSNTYFGIVNLNAYAGSSINIGLNLTSYGNGVWNIHAGSYITGKIRARETSTINLIGSGALENLNELSLDGASTKLNLNLSDGDFFINNLSFAYTSTLKLSLSAQSKIVFASVFGKDGNFGTGTTNRSGNSIVIENFSNDMVFFGLNYDIEVVGNNLRITKNNVSMDIALKAYFDSENGEEVLGDWYLESSDGYYALNNTAAIPEPAAISAIFSILSLLLFLRLLTRRNS